MCRIVGEGRTGDQAERNRQQQLRRGDLGIRQTPTLGVIQEPDIERIDMQVDQCLLEPADHPYEVDVIADLPDHLVAHTGDQRPGHQDRQQDKVTCREVRETMSG